MNLFSYIVSRDFGFAPNPFDGFCTLATCKPKIRQRANIGDWVVGTGSKARGMAGQLVYAMKVDEIISFQTYWEDPRFRTRRPQLNGSLKKLYGDNIYHPSGEGSSRCDAQPLAGWNQADSHHSLWDGTPNEENMLKDLGADLQYNRVLVSWHYFYWGGDAHAIPHRFRDWHGVDLCCSTQGHKNRPFPDGMKITFVEWLESLGENGYLGDPYEFRSHRRLR